jgi:hypothetical protein
MADIFSELDVQLGMLDDALHGGIVGGMGATFAQYLEPLLQTDILLRLYKGSAYTIGVAPYVQRHYNAMYAPNEPDELLAFHLERRGQIARPEFNTFLSHKGWAGKWYDKLYSIFTKIPDPWLAFSMFKRGLINQSVYTRFLRAEGYDDSLLVALQAAMYRVPRLNEITRISDFVELPETYVAEKLRQDGYADADIPYLVTAISRRPNRQEARTLITEFIYEFKEGRASQAELLAGFGKAGSLPTEIALNLIYAAHYYANELTNKALLVLEQRAAKHDLSTMGAMLTELEALGINVDTANEIAAKWYWQYIAEYQTWGLYTATNDVGLGTTDPAPGFKRYDAGQYAKIYAVPALGHTLDHWNIDGVDVGTGEISETVLMTMDHAVTAVFV